MKVSEAKMGRVFVIRLEDGDILHEEGNPILHMHLACGRGDQTITGCVRRGVKVWHVLEIILTELTGTRAVRRPDTATGFNLLSP